MSLSVYAQGARTTITDYPVEWPITMCNGESVLFQGTMTRINRTVTDNNGGVHHQLKVNLDMSGVDNNGNKYTIATWNIKVNSNQDGDYDGSQTNFVENETSILVIRDEIKGKNFKSKYVGHVAVNKNGYTPYFQHTVSGC